MQSLIFTVLLSNMLINIIKKNVSYKSYHSQHLFSKIKKYKRSRTKTLSISPSSISIILFLTQYHLYRNEACIPSKAVSENILLPPYSLLLDDNLTKITSNENLKIFVLHKFKISHSKKCAGILLLLAGDINPNPGPQSQRNANTCPACFRTVAKNHRAVECDQCKKWLHIKCDNISVKSYNSMLTASDDDTLNFVCSICLRNELPFEDGYFDNSFPNDDVEPDISSFEPHFDFDLGSTNKKGFKMGHLNVNGLRSKLDYIKVFLHEHKLDILALNETKIDSHVTNADITIPGYNIFRCDRNKHGGGVLIYAIDTLPTKKLSHLSKDNIESIWIEVKLKKSSPIFLCSIYRPPAKGKDLVMVERLSRYIKDCLKNLPKNPEVFILGDLNCNFNKPNNLTRILKDCLVSCNLKQFIDKDTRTTISSSTLIDLFISNSEHICHSSVIDMGLSDHSFIYAIHKWKRVKIPAKVIKSRSFRNFNKENFLYDLHSVNWNEILNKDNLDTACNIFNEFVTNIIDQHAPIKSSRVKGNCPQWLNDDLIHAIKERDFLKKKASKTKLIADWDKFKFKRNQVNKMKERLKGHHYGNKINEDASDPKRLWKTLKELVPDKENKNVPSSISKNDMEINDPKGVSNSFNSFFATIGSTLAQKFTSDTSDVNIKCNDKNFIFKEVDENTVTKMITGLKNNKATGTDKIGVRVLKAGLQVFSPVLTKLFNKSLTTGYVPSCWKNKRVSPLFKSGDPSDVNNYRPISILPVVMKVFEKIVHEQMVEFLLENNLLNCKQSGFRKLHSTSTAAIDVSDYILNEMGKGKYVGAVLIDFKKAFDTVDHKILLKKLYCYGFRDGSFDWLESYLSNRHQVTLVNNTMSDVISEESYGVPQGSVLGPLLFLVYINDLESAIHNSYFHLYADDTIIIQSCNSPIELKSALEIELNNVKQWIHINKVTINTDKTEVIFFGNKTKLKACTDITISYDGIELTSRKKVKYLGVIFDSNLSWKSHIKSVVSKSYYKFNKIRYISSYLNDETKQLLINALVMPYLYYCSPTWCNANNSSLKKVNKLFSNINTFVGRDASDLNSLFNFNSSISIFKAVHEIAPAYLSNKLTLIKSNHCHSTRSSTSNMLVSHRSGARCFNRTFLYSSPKLWNSLPDDIRKLNSLLQFKVAVGKHYNFK